MCELDSHKLAFLKVSKEWRHTLVKHGRPELQQVFSDRVMNGQLLPPQPAVAKYRESWTKLEGVMLQRVQIRNCDLKEAVEALQDPELPEACGNVKMLHLFPFKVSCQLPVCAWAVMHACMA
jgi:hypothetical protein